MTDKEIDDFLIEINSTNDKTLLFEKIDDLSNLTDNVEFSKYTSEARVYEYLSEEIELIRITSGSYDDYIVYGLTKKGRGIIDDGGWLNYVKKQKIINKRKEDKDKFDLIISKLQAKTGWLPYVVSIIGLILSGIAIYISIIKE